MSAVRRKLNSQAGVAMVIALVFFLLCVMVGVVIVTAATVSAGSVALERETWRETEALTSAAQLLTDDVTTMKFTGAYTETETVTTTVTKEGEGDSATYETKVTEEGPIFTQTGTDGEATKLTSDLLNDSLITTLYQANAGINSATLADVEVTLTFTASATDTNSQAVDLNVPEVECTLTVSKDDYTIKAKLTCGSSTLTMVFQPQVSESAGTATQNTVKGEENYPSTATKTTTTPYTTTITWGDPVITKGGATS